ncbi:MAG TPA: hypothetical protein VMC85_25130 [Desulfomonilaceae bacterium]|nr:hypothetical protein [Desulfomonilaceae bacterium]
MVELESGRRCYSIGVGEGKIRLTGLKEAIEEIAQSHAGSLDGEIQDALLEKLSEKNYIADRGRKEYGKAFLREFKKFLGQPYEKAFGTSRIKGKSCC